MGSLLLVYPILVGESASGWCALMLIAVLFTAQDLEIVMSHHRAILIWLSKVYVLTQQKAQNLLMMPSSLSTLVSHCIIVCQSVLNDLCSVALLSRFRVLGHCICHPLCHSVCIA